MTIHRSEQSIPTITVVTSPGCRLCEDAEAALAGLAREFVFRTRSVEARSHEGSELLARTRAAMTPLVLVDDEMLSAGRLPRGKMRTRLAGHERTAG